VLLHREKPTGDKIAGVTEIGVLGEVEVCFFG
jgi:hypothetical protein